MRYIITFITVILLLGCQSQEDIDREAQAKKYKQEQLLKIQEQKRLEELRVAEAKKEAERLEREKNASTIHQMGLSMNDGKIIFDTNMAKNFFGSIVEKIEKSTKEIENNSSKFTQQMGVTVSPKEDNITIDFNKTRAFFEHWSSKIELFAKDISSFGEKIEDNNHSK